jgi:hypothetical protein
MNYKSMGLFLAAASILLAAANPAFAQNWAYNVALPERNQVANADGLVWVLSSVACSADGTVVVAAANGGLVCISTNLGATWQATPLPTNGWTGVACSADGMEMVAVAESYTVNDGYMTLYTSSDTGASWTLQSAAPYAGVGNFDEWWCVASSADGIKLAAGVEELDTNQTTSPLLFGGIALSSDSGVTWQPSSLTGVWTAVASSANGSTLVALGRYGFPATNQQAVYFSTDAGGSWQPANLPNQFLNFVTVSGDGSTMVATGTNVFTSRDSGTTWLEWTNAPQGTLGPVFWTAPAVSEDGTKMMVGGFGGGSPGSIYTSDDSGVTWASTNNAFSGASAFLYASASSADGRELVALPRNGTYVFTLDYPHPGHVYCACNSNAIAGATVKIGTNTATCDDSGEFIIANLTPGFYPAVVSASNYETLTTNIVVYANQPVTNNFYLTNTTFVIDPVFDSSLTDLSNFEDISNSIVQSLQIYSQTIADPLCVRIQFAALGSGLASSLAATGIIPYSQYFADLQANTNMSANDITALATLHAPPNTGINTNSRVELTAATFDVIGEHAVASALVTGNGGLNAKVSLNFSILNITRPPQDPANYDLSAAVQHEVDEVLGIGGWGSTLYLATAWAGQAATTNAVGSLDLYRYVGPGLRSFSFATNIAPYFSITGGTSPLVNFNQNGSGSDYGDWGDGVIPPDRQGHTPAQVQDAFGAPGTTPNLGSNEFIALDVVGYTLQNTTSIQSVMFNGGTFTFTVATLPGQTCQVQFTTSLGSTIWQNLNGPFVATGMTQTITDTTASGTARYYRVVVVPAANPQQTVIKSRPRPIDPVETPVPLHLELHHFLPSNRNNRQ